jgi:hypothetical protein
MSCGGKSRQKGGRISGSAAAKTHYALAPVGIIRGKRAGDKSRRVYHMPWRLRCYYDRGTSCSRMAVFSTRPVVALDNMEGLLTPSGPASAARLPKCGPGS